MTVASARLLEADEPSPVEVLNPEGRSMFLLTGDHAGRRLPRALGSLGLSEHELSRHIAVDIGVAGLARHLARELDACAILQTYSRLAIDCNRPLGSPESIASLSELTPIPGNRNPSAHDVRARQSEIFAPYHSRITAELDRRAQAGHATLLVMLHSFTPSFLGVARPWHVGVLYHRDARLAKALLTLLRQQGDLVVGDNQPYSAGEDTDYAVPVHGERRGLPYVELELRQDLLDDEVSQHRWAARLAPLLQQAQFSAMPNAAC